MDMNMDRIRQFLEYKGEDEYGSIRALTAHFKSIEETWKDSGKRRFGGKML